MTLDQWFFLVLGVALGGALSLWITNYYAATASRELDHIARAFAKVAEARGWAEWTRNKKGEMTFGRLVRGSAGLTASNASVSAEVQVIHKDKLSE